MAHFLLIHETGIRLACFLGLFAFMAAWEVLAPRRVQAYGRARRWPANLGIIAVDTLTVRLVFPVAAIGVATLASARGWGLLPALPLPGWLRFIAALLLLDLAIYLQHLLFHAVPWLWRFHRMHHADLEFDVTTGARFHPVEIVLSLAIKLAVVAALGVSPAAVLVFEVLLNATSMFNHGNVRLPMAVDRVLRRFIVTPDMHRVHHSMLRQETNSNFGFNLSAWDRLFGTYRAQPAAGHLGMTIGLAQFRDPRELGLVHLLTQPFRRDGATREPGPASAAGRFRRG